MTTATTTRRGKSNTPNRRDREGRTIKAYTNGFAAIYPVPAGYKVTVDSASIPANMGRRLWENTQVKYRAVIVTKDGACHRIPQDEVLGFTYAEAAATCWLHSEQPLPTVFADHHVGPTAPGLAVQREPIVRRRAAAKAKEPTISGLPRTSAKSLRETAALLTALATLLGG